MRGAEQGEMEEFKGQGDGEGRVAAQGVQGMQGAGGGEQERTWWRGVMRTGAGEGDGCNVSAKGVPWGWVGEEAAGPRGGDAGGGHGGQQAGDTWHLNGVHQWMHQSSISDSNTKL